MSIAGTFQAGNLCAFISTIQLQICLLVVQQLSCWIHSVATCGTLVVMLESAFFTTSLYVLLIVFAPECYVLRSHPWFEKESGQKLSWCQSQMKVQNTRCPVELEVKQWLNVTLCH